MDWINALSGLIWSIGFLVLAIGLVKPMGTALTEIATRLTTKKAAEALKLMEDARKLLSRTGQELLAARWTRSAGE